MRSLFRVTYYDGDKQKQGDVVAVTVAEAAAHLGLSQWLSAVNLIHHVEVAGVDPQHATVAPQQPTIEPPFVPLFNEVEIERLGAHFSPDEIKQLRSKLTPAEIAEVRSTRLTEGQATTLKAALKAKDARYVYRHA